MNFINYSLKLIWNPFYNNIQNYCKSSLNKRKLLNEKYRIRLAAAYRGLDQYGLNEGICNHLSVKAPSLKSDEDIMLIIPYGLHWKEVTPSALIGVDKRNEVIEGEGEPELTALCIHKGIYDKRPDVKSIMHTHMPYATALTCLKEPELRMVHQNSARFYNRIAYDITYGGLGDSSEEGHRLAEVLGNKDVLFMGNHGVLIVADSTDIAFDSMYYLERAAMIQVLAYSTNIAVRELDQHTIDVTSKQIWSSLPRYAEAHLDTVIRQLSISCSEFRMIGK